MSTSDGTVELAVTVIGPDRPGIVADVARALAELRVNLTDSTMTLLRGHFAMMLICSAPASPAQVEAALSPLAADGQLLVTVRDVSDEEHVPANGQPHGTSQFVLSVHGADRLGIVATVAGVIAEAGGNITDLSTRLVGPLYLLVAEVDLPDGVAADLVKRLAEVAGELGVEVTLRPAGADVL